MLLGLRRSGKTWALQALEDHIQRAGRKARYRDFEGQIFHVPKDLRDGDTLLIDEPGEELENRQHDLVDACRKLHGKGVRVVVAVTPLELELLESACKGGNGSIARSRLRLDPLTPEQQKSLAKHDDGALALLDRVLEGVPEGWRRTPYHLELHPAHGRQPRRRLDPRREGRSRASRNLRDHGQPTSPRDHDERGRTSYEIHVLRHVRDGNAWKALPELEPIKIAPPVWSRCPGSRGWPSGRAAVAGQDLGVSLSWTELADRSGDPVPGDHGVQTPPGVIDAARLGGDPHDGQVTHGPQLAHAPVPPEVDDEGAVAAAPSPQGHVGATQAGALLVDRGDLVDRDRPGPAKALQVGLGIALEEAARIYRTGRDRTRRRGRGRSGGRRSRGRGGRG